MTTPSDTYLTKWNLDPAKNRETDSHVCFLEGPLSQGFGSPFTDHGKKLFEWDDGVARTFKSAEEFMMFHKAKLFGNHDIADQILQANDPAEQKALGRKVQGFDPAIWDQQAVRIVATGNYYKFSQNPELKEELLRTQDKVLAYANGGDKIWGVGLNAADPLILDSAQWKGTNLLGDCLMAVRQGLQKQRAPETEVADVSREPLAPQVLERK